MDAFATVDEVEAGFRPLTPSEREVAEQLLPEATARIMADVMWDEAKVDSIIGEFEQYALGVVCASMVRNALRPATSTYGGFDAAGSAGEWASDLVANNPYPTGRDLALIESLKARFNGGGIGFGRF